MLYIDWRPDTPMAARHFSFTLALLFASLTLLPITLRLDSEGARRRITSLLPLQADTPHGGAPEYYCL